MDSKSSKKIGKKAAKILLWFLGCFVALDLLLAGLLLIPAVQTFAVNKITEKVSQSWGTGISLKHVRLSPTLHIVADELHIEDNRQQDMIYVGKVKCRLTGLGFNPFKLKFGSVTLSDADIVLRTYSGDTTINIAAWAAKFKKNDNTSSSFLLTAKHLTLVNSRFVLINDDKRTVFETGNVPPIDYAYFELKNINWEVDKFIVANDSVAAKFKHLSFEQYGGFAMTDAQGEFSIWSQGLRFQKLKAKTPNSRLDIDLAFDYDAWSSYSEFTDSVRIQAAVRPSMLCMKDVAAFVPSLRGMEETLFLKSERISGPVNDFSIIGLRAACGFKNRINGDLVMKDITRFPDTYLNVQLDSCTLYAPELALLTLPGGKSPGFAKKTAFLGNTALKVSFIGTMEDFDANLAARTDAGNLSAEMRTFSDNGQTVLKGKLDGEAVNLARITGADKALGKSSFSLAAEGSMASTGWSKKNLQTLKASLDGDIAHIDIIGYPLRHTMVSGEYADKLCQAVVETHDPHLECTVSGNLDLSEETPFLQGDISLDHFDLGYTAGLLPKRDSTAAGTDKIIYVLQNNPTLKTGFDNFSFTLRGSSIDDVTGYLGCDNIWVFNNGDSIRNCRFRVTSICNDLVHKFIVSSNVFNATLENNYPIGDIANYVMHQAHGYFPSLVDEPAGYHLHGNGNASMDDRYLKVRVSTYETNRVLRMLIPDIIVAPNSNLEAELYADAHNDLIKANIPFFAIKNKLSVHHLSLNSSSSDTSRIGLQLNTDSVHIGDRKKHLCFHDIVLHANSSLDSVFYDLKWNNRHSEAETYRSTLSGCADLSDPDDLVLRLHNTTVYLDEMAWHFREGNDIHFQKQRIAVNNLVFENDSSSVTINGDYSTKQKSRLNLLINTLDMSIVNPLLNNMTCGGLLTADMMLLNGDRRLILGKMLADNFVFNEEKIGNLFLMAGWDTQNRIGFNGGFFRSSNSITAATLTEYDVRRFRDEKSTFAKVNGYYAPDAKKFAVHTEFDTLNVGFLEPFLSGISDQVSGTASGKLSFYASADSTYFDGVVRLLSADMSIAPLGTLYHFDNQDLRFNDEGIFFDHIKFSDNLQNIAYMDGSIRHRMFKDMKIDLKIHTDGVTVLSTPKSDNSVFYGTGVAAGDVEIGGTDKGMTFRGANLKTLSGTKIYLLVSTASSASESTIIRFKTTADTSQSAAAQSKNGMDLDFDFTFNVTDDADIVLLLESIGGTMNAKANGNFRLTFNNNDNLNLYGSLALHSGDFRFSLYDIVNSRFTLVPGGQITFDGPLNNMVVNASAYKSSKTSLASIVPQEYLSGSNTTVNAYLHLNGEIMRNLEPTFSFELPNSSTEARNIFYNAIDTTNKENMTKQFAYFMVSNNFIPSTPFSSGTGGLSSSYSLLSSALNSMLQSVMENRHGSVGVIYNSASETTSAEYGIQANANLLNDRITMSTSFGYYDNRETESAAENMYGDVIVEYSINKSGTWKLKAYTYVGEHDQDIYSPDINSKINYTAGVALGYKQSFDSRYRRKLRAGTPNISKRRKNHD